MKKKGKFIRLWVGRLASLSLFLMNVSDVKANQVSLSGSPTHIGTFEGSTTFTTSSSNGVNPGLYLEVMDRYGKITTYESEDGIITVPDTKEGAYVTQAKFLGKTKYKDLDTDEILDEWEEGRNLELVSVENPILTTIGKNLFNGEFNHGSSKVSIGTHFDESFNNNDTKRCYSQLFDVKDLRNVTITLTNSNQKYAIYQWDKDKKFVNSSGWTSSPMLTIELASSAEYISVYMGNVNDSNVELLEHKYSIQIEGGTKATNYQPYQSNILTLNEDVKLREVGVVKDEFDLVIGRLIQRTDEVLLDGSENWDLSDGDVVGGMNYLMNSNNDVKKNVDTFKVNTVSDVIPSIRFTDIWNERLEGLSTSNSDKLGFRISTTKFKTAKEFKTFLTLNPLTVQYQKVTTLNRKIFIHSTYTFGRVSMRDVYVDGDVKSLICSVNVPTESLTFVLDPNQEEGQQFIAPTFNLINETPTSIRVTLSAFTQETNVFNDVLPTQHSDWSQLNREQSKDIALALVPVVSDGWLTVDETPRYVANNSSVVLGEIKAKSTVSLTFEALHGQAFIENLSPRYRLVFVFDF